MNQFEFRNDLNICPRQVGHDDIKHRNLQANSLPKNAIILAAGRGTRLTPIGRSMHKGLLQVKNEILIERLISQCQRAGISDITVVTGYESDSLAYLADKYQVNLVHNPQYQEHDSLSSVACVLEKIDNTFIIPCDLYLKQNVFAEKYTSSWYGMTWQPSQHAYVKMADDFTLTKASIGHVDAGGLMYLDHHDALLFRNRIKDAMVQKNEAVFYEDVLFEDGTMLFKGYPLVGVYEVNSYDELIAFDPTSQSLEHEVLIIIKDCFQIEATDIKNITLLKAGMTNNSFIFTVNSQRYIMRLPGEGTENLINRHQEKAVYDVISDYKISDDVIYFNADSGHKITRFLEGAHNLDPFNIEEVSQCMKFLKNFHDQKFVVNHSFELIKLIEYYESLRGKTSLYADYEQVKQNVLSLKPFIDRCPVERCLTHIDAVCDNFILTDHEIRLIDFEYSAMQDPHLDLAMFSIYAMYDRQAIDQLIDIYFENQCSLQNRAKIYAYIAIAGLLWSNWCEYKFMLGISFGDYALAQYQYAKDYYYILTTEFKEVLE